MNIPSSHETLSARLRMVVRSLAYALRPTARITILGRSFRVAFASRGIWVERDYAFLRRLSLGQKLIFDVGANKGIVSLLMADQLVEGGRIVAFEACAEAARLAAVNAALNGLSDRLNVVQALVAERSGLVLPFHAQAASVHSSMVINPFGDQPAMFLPTLALDDYARETGCWPTLVKIDVEGAEARVWEGMANILAKNRPTVFMELHAIGGSVSDMAACLLLRLSAAEYRMIGLSTQREIRSANEIVGSPLRTFVLLLPRERTEPDWLAGFDTATL